LVVLPEMFPTGKHSNGRETHGHSLIIDPWGDIVSSLSDGVGVITAEVNLERLKRIRNNIPVDKHQKIFETN